MNSVERPESLSDDVLLSRVEELVRRTRRAEAELIWHLAEVDRRMLYRREACSSMYAYATERLRLSEAEAFLRIAVARASRRFPAVLRMLADGRLHLSGIAKLAPHLRDDNCDALLAQATHRSKREIEKLIARLAPRLDLPSGMRRLPAPRPPEVRPGGVDNREVAPSEPAPAGQDRGAPRQAVLAPLAESTYKVQFTAGEELHEKIIRAQALLRHQIPGGDLAALFDRAMTLLVRELERVRYAATAAPRKTAAESDPTPSSRHIPDAIKREVWIRDGEQCTFHDHLGRRCSARAWLEIHHVVPLGRGGEHSPANLTLRCATHNAYQAELDYGAEFMAERRANRRQKSRGSGRCGEARPPGFGFDAVYPKASASPRFSVLGPPLMDNAPAWGGALLVGRVNHSDPQHLSVLGSGFTTTHTEKAAGHGEDEGRCSTGLACRSRCRAGARSRRPICRLVAAPPTRPDSPTDAANGGPHLRAGWSHLGGRGYDGPETRRARARDRRSTFGCRP